MVITPHAVAGAAVARRLPSARIALVAGVATHFALDRVPHRDYPLRAIALLSADAAVAAVLTHRLSRANPTVMLAGAIGGVLPDVAQVVERVAHVNITRPAHRANHTKVVWPAWAGLGTQVVTVAACVGAVTVSNRRQRSNAVDPSRRSPTPSPNAGTTPRRSAGSPWIGDAHSLRRPAGVGAR